MFIDRITVISAITRTFIFPITISDLFFSKSFGTPGYIPYIINKISEKIIRNKDKKYDETFHIRRYVVYNDF